ncbi:MAG: hypothetical protein ACP6IT_07570 [Candidatus Thorarchaeota archaeon]
MTFPIDGDALSGIKGVGLDERIIDVSEIEGCRNRRIRNHAVLKTNKIEWITCEARVYDSDIVTIDKTQVICVNSGIDRVVLIEDIVDGLSFVSVRSINVVIPFVFVPDASS